MRLALAQLNATVGDLRGNAGLILAAARRAAAAGCDLLVTPELMLCGYPPQDLLFKAHFIEAQLAELEGLARELPLPALVGCVYPDAAAESMPADPYERVAAETPLALSNAAVLLRAGRLETVSRKMLLPTYDVFDEWRYFRPGEPCLVEVAGWRVGVTICEDLWDTAYSRRPAADLAAAGAALLVNLSASPFHAGHFKERLAVCRRQARTLGLPVAYCNLVGGQDELIFDGRSMLLDESGELQQLGSAWAEDLLLLDLPALPGGPGAVLPAEDGPAEVFAALVLGLRDYARKCGFTTAVLGLSGGIDSALVACLAAEALGAAQVTALGMPSRYTAAMSNDDAALLAQRLGIGWHLLPIEDTLPLAEQRFSAEFGAHHRPITLENMQSRERGQVLMEFSNDRGALLLATGNKTEYALGYSTLYGDMCGGLAVIGDLNKLDVYALAQWYNAQAGREVIPARTLRRVPSAELAENQVDPFDYAVIAPLTDLVVEGQLGRAALRACGYSEGDIDRVLRLVRLSEYKRKQAPPILRVSPKAFGIGRRMPIVNAFDG
jgi:NAD+ synthase (glutamine-hydrolysing)